MIIFLETVDVIAILLMIFMLVVILKQPPSRSQTAFVIYDLFTIIFVVGIHLELIHSNTVNEALSGLCVQYVGQAGFLMALVWFASEFAKFPIPIWVYVIEAVINAVVLLGVFTAERHTLFYSRMRILTDGMYDRIEVDGGIIWGIHYVHMVTVILMLLILCVLCYGESTRIQKKRICYVGVGVCVLGFELLLKGIGVFGSYNPVVIAMTITMFFMMLAMVKHGYFGSLHAAVDNAFNHGNEGLIILDSEKEVVFINHRMAELFPELKIGENIYGQNEIAGLIDGEESLLYKDGVTYELRVEDIVEEGEKSGSMLWLIDQTQAIETMRQLREADEAKTQFLMKISHELRTPMNTMLGMNEMIIRETDDSQIREYAGEVEKAGEHMLALINEVLETSRLRDGSVTITDAPYYMEDVIKKAVELMRPQAEKKNLRFVVKQAKELSDKKIMLYGDSGHIFQALVNLLSNAIKYTDSGKITVSSELRSGEPDMFVEISVSDTGTGIRKEELEHIFENFGRGTNARNRDGMGLGLAIVNQLVREMGGKVTVDSVLGMGSVFTIVLPFRQSTSGATSDATADTIADDKKDYSSKIILAVDDNEQNLKVLKHLLRNSNVNIDMQKNGDDAVNACREKRYDLILLDHMMYGMDGVETLHKIKEDDEGLNRDTAVIALTANAAPGAKQFYISEGFSDYISKPINPKSLDDILSIFLGEREDMEDLNKCGINVAEGLRYADDDRELYLELLGIFSDKHEEKLKLLSEAIKILQDENAAPEEKETAWNNWTVTCHSLKGEAKGIGAGQLGEDFYKLELAGKEKNPVKIKEIYSEVFTRWKKTAEAIQKFL